jgi:hypothetical protein
MGTVEVAGKVEFADEVEGEFAGHVEFAGEVEG